MRLVHGCRDIEPDVDGVEEANCTRSGRALESITYQGAVHMTRGYTEVATFNFERVYLGRWVKVHTTGSRALSLLSRSSMIIDCPIVVEPGTLGGFPGGRLPRDFNFNGPGSGSVRVFEKTITTRAPNVDEVQRITTYATPGENIAGGFTLKYCRGANSKAVQCDVSERIPFDATAAGPSRGCTARARRAKGVYLDSHIHLGDRRRAATRGQVVPHGVGRDGDRRDADGGQHDLRVVQPRVYGRANESDSP